MHVHVEIIQLYFWLWNFVSETHRVYQYLYLSLARDFQLYDLLFGVHIILAKEVGRFLLVMDYGLTNSCHGHKYIFMSIFTRLSLLG